MLHVFPSLWGKNNAYLACILNDDKIIAIAMNKAQVRSDLKQNTRELLQSISDFPEAHFNSRPTEGQWTAGQVAEHLIKVETSTIKLFVGSTEPSNRNPGLKITNIKERLLDFNSKMKAFGPIIPDDSPKEKTAVLDRLQDLRQRLTGMIEIEDLTVLVNGFEHPLFGTLTRLEWIYFNIYHSRRHNRQIKNLWRTLSKKT